MSSCFVHREEGRPSSLPSQRRLWIEESEKPQNRFEQTYSSLVEDDDVWSWVLGYPTIGVAITVEVPDELDFEVNFAHRCRSEVENNDHTWRLNKLFVPGTGVQVRWSPDKNYGRGQRHR